MDALLAHIRRYISLSNHEFDEVKGYFHLRSLPKSTFFCRAGEICQKVAFVESGALRSYYTIREEEVTRFVLLKDNFITALSSFITQQSSPENIQAIQHCQLYEISYDDLQILYEKYPRWQKLGRLIMEESHLRLERRVLSLISLNAEERYGQLMREQPELLQQVPLQYVASILGVTPETLSRIRKKRSP